MYLVDTNVWLERLLDLARSEDVASFLGSITSELLFITDFAFHSIAVVMTKLNRLEGLIRFVQDAFIDGSVVLIHLDPTETQSVINIKEQFNFDFDDAYHYTAAEKYNLTIVSFDSDFDRTRRGRKTPGEIVKA